jgi:DNA polymerase III subunit chi
MTRVDFYRLTRDPVERVLPAIAAKIIGERHRMLIVAAAALQRQAIDDALWTLQPASFLPHGAAGTADEHREPILLSGTLDVPAANGATHVALADGEWDDAALKFERVFLLFDDRRTDDARTTWRRLNAMPEAEINFWKQDERGRWSEGP